MFSSPPFLCIHEEEEKTTGLDLTNGTLYQAQIIFEIMPESDRRYSQEVLQQ